MERHGVGVDALEEVAFPDHERVGRALVRPSTLEELDDEIEAGLRLSEVETVLEAHGLEDASAVLAELGYRVEWEGLVGGTVVER